MPVIGAIDIGSNAMRLAVATVSARGTVHVGETMREPVRLGAEVFRGEPIGEATMLRAFEALRRFHRVFRKWDATLHRVVATSALREAVNRDEFVARAAAASGVAIRVISGEEEARLIHLGVAHAVDFHEREALLIDIGGGSVEVSVATRSTILAAETFALGTVRLLQAFGDGDRIAGGFPTLVREYTGAARRRLTREIGRRKISLCIGTGGNIEALRDLRTRLLGKRDGRFLTRPELHEMIGRIRAESFEGRMRVLGMRADRADVIVPASLVLEHLLEITGMQRVLIPKVGLREGLLWDLAPDAIGKPHVVDERQAVQSARELGERYRYDAAHATTVTTLAMQLFDGLRSVHRLGSSERTLLEIAALLHDVGHVVNANGHHKHSAYLITSSPLIGLDEEQKAVVALIARYHRKALPKIGQEAFDALPVRRRDHVSKLSMLLRLAESLDCEHAGFVRRVRCERRTGTVTLHVTGTGDLLLERWSVLRAAPLFQRTFHLPLHIAK